MAITQTAADYTGFGNVTTKDADGYYYTTLGSIRLYCGSGSPHTIITAPIGSLYIRNDAGAVNLYINTNASTTWAAVGGQS